MEVPPLHLLVSFCAAAFAIIVVPGPSVLFVVSRAVALGRRAALATVVGNTIGEAVQAAAVAVGLGALVARSATVFTVLKVAGALYLVVLGIRMVRNRAALSEAVAQAVVPRSTARIVREGFTVGLLNPKTTVFFAAVLPQFVDRSSGHVGVQMAVLGVVFALIALASDSTWGLAAGTARTWLAGNPRRLQAMGGIGGVTVMALGVRLAVTGRHD